MALNLIDSDDIKAFQSENNLSLNLSEDVKSKMGGNSVPVGSEFEYDGETVPDGYEEVDNPTNWKLVNSVVGTETVTLPSDFNEILVIIKEGSSNNVNYSFLIPKLYLNTTAKGFTDGYYVDAVTRSRIRIMVSTTEVNLTVAMLDSENDVRSSSTITIYYR